MTINEYYKRHWNKTEQDEQRLGQRFVNEFIKQPWPELFYCTDNNDAMWMIETWLEDNHYRGELPQKVK